MTSEYSFGNAQKQLESRLHANPIPSIPNSSVHWELGSFTTPDGDYAQTFTTIATADSVQAGGGWNRAFGTFTVLMRYRPSTTESKRSQVAANIEHIERLYHQQRFNSVNCESATPDILGVNAEDGMYEAQVVVVFYYEGP